METPKLTIAVINFNGMEFLESCLETLLKTTYENFEIMLIDQASTDDSVKFVKRTFKQVKVVENENTGYAGGANKAYELADGEYLVVMNPDVKVTGEYFEKLIYEMELDPKIGAITGKILKTENAKTREEGHTEIIDTIGLEAFKNRRVVDKAQGFTDSAQFDDSMEVFGVSGCLATYRMKALKDIAVPSKSEHAINGKEVWDFDFFMYKEDIDVSWRLNLRGWKCVYDASAKAYHRRGTKVLKRYTNKDVLKHRKSVPFLAKYHSYKNQRLMQLKNEITKDYFKDFFTLFFREILTFGYVLIREPKTALAIKDMIILLPRMFKKRLYIQKHRKVQTMKHFLAGDPKDAFENWQA